MQGPVDGPEPIMVGYLDKFSMTGLVKVRRASGVLLETLRVCSHVAFRVLTLPTAIAHQRVGVCIIYSKERCASMDMYR